MGSGGKRKGAGRKLKYGEKTKTIAFRVPVSLIEEIQEYVTEKLKEMKYLSI